MVLKASDGEPKYVDLLWSRVNDSDIGVGVGVSIRVTQADVAAYPELEGRDSVDLILTEDGTVEEVCGPVR